MSYCFIVSDTFLGASRQWNCLDVWTYVDSASNSLKHPYFSTNYVLMGEIKFSEICFR